MKKYSESKFGYIGNPKIKNGDLYCKNEFRFTNKFPFYKFAWIVYKFNNPFWVECND